MGDVRGTAKRNTSPTRKRLSRGASPPPRSGERSYSGSAGASSSLSLSHRLATVATLLKSRLTPSIIETYRGLLQWGELPMAFVPQFEHDIFISYAHADNVPRLAGEAGWIEDFHSALVYQLGRRMGKSKHLDISRAARSRNERKEIVAPMNYVPMIYFTSHPDDLDSDQAREVYEYLLERNYDVIESEAASDQKREEAYIEHCDGVMIFSGVGETGWVKDKAVQTRMLTMRRRDRPLAAAVYNGPPITRMATWEFASAV